LELVPSCLINCDLELREIIYLTSSLHYLCITSPSCDLASLDQHAYTLCYLESRLTISLDNLNLEYFMTLRKMLIIEVVEVFIVDSKNLLDRVSSCTSLFLLPECLKADNTIRVNQLVTILQVESSIHILDQ
ncbi:hypothetical protein Tco_0299926, partial [Tanacetum coccineum]